MFGFLGEFEVKVDAKGRLMLPVGFKKQLGQGDGIKFILNRGFEKCLTLYTEKQWAKVEETLNALNDYNEKARKLKRWILNGATILEPDSIGRILIPKSMLQHADLEKEAVFSAQVDKVEIWNARAYHQLFDDNADMNALAGEVLGADFLNPLRKTDE